MSDYYKDWELPEGLTPADILDESPKQRRERLKVEKWKQERIDAHYRMLKLFTNGKLEPHEAQLPSAQLKKLLKSAGTAWS
jgi:hypothetical protein